ncbi:MAG: phosphatase [Geminicoccaceae bacterium]|nr:MAG: phosphatase [Geminicoccaceae bacterium]
MIEQTRINERLTVGMGYPDEGDLRDLARAGIRAVANLRTHGEPEQPLKPDEEGRWARQLGLAYLHYPVTSDQLETAVVDGFRAALDRLPRPLFAHCASGTRSGAFLMMHVAAETGLTGDEALAKAEAMGFACDEPAIERFVRDYVEAHREA